MPDFKHQEKSKVAVGIYGNMIEYEPSIYTYIRRSGINTLKNQNLTLKYWELIHQSGRNDGI